MAPHSSTFAWKIPWMEEPGRLQSTGSLESGTTERLHFHFSLSCIGEGNGNPLQCSCLENPRDREAWWAAIYGVAESQTRLKRLSSSSSSRTNYCLGSSYWEESATENSSSWICFCLWNSHSGIFQSGNQAGTLFFTVWKSVKTTQMRISRSC